MIDRPATLRELKESGYRPISVKAEMRRNLLNKLRNEEDIFPGILGFDETVIPQIENAVLSRHDMLFLGLRGQGKTRMLRMLVNLLDEVIPVVAGSEINDDPFAPVSKFARDRIAEQGDDCPLEWLRSSFQAGCRKLRSRSCWRLRESQSARTGRSILFLGAY